VEERILEKTRTLVAKGMEAFSSRRFGEPEGDNAIYWARQLRRVDPDHAVAKELESRAAVSWENEAKAAAARQQFDQARQIYQKLAALFPDHSAYVTELAALEKQRQAALLLLRAEEALKAGRSGEPAGENAIELSRQVLQTDPANTAARELETRAATAYEGVARRAVEDNNRKRAVEIYTRLAALFPGRKEYRREVENLQATSIPVVHYHELKRVFRFPLPVKLVHKGCWGSLSLTPRGLEFRGRGGNDARVDDFVASAAELRARTGTMAKPGALDNAFRDSGVHMTHIITLAGRAGETRFYVSAESANVFRTYTTEFWNWKWGNLEPAKGKKKQ